MAFGGLSNWFKKRVEDVRDVFDANTAADVARRQQQQFKSVPFRLAAPQSYQDQQRSLGRTPISNPALQIANQFVKPVTQFVNTGELARDQVINTGRMYAAQATNNPTAFKNAVAQTQKDYSQAQNGGIMGQGTFFKNSQEAQSGELGTAIKRIGGGTLETAATVVPFAKGATFVKPGVGLARNIPRLAAEGAAQGGVFSAGSQLVEEGKINPARLAKDTVLGAGMSVAGGAASKVARERTPLNEVGAVGKNVNQPIDPLDSLKQEAKKYKSAEEFISNYNGSATQYGEYNPQFRVGGIAGAKRLNEVGIDPNKEVTVYRGIDDLSGKVPRKINDGDFVTTDYESALAYTGSPKDVVSMKVKAKDLMTDDPKNFTSEPFYTGSEYIYSSKYDAPKPLDRQQLTDLYNQATASKPLIIAPPPKPQGFIVKETKPLNTTEVDLQRVFDSNPNRPNQATLKLASESPSPQASPVAIKVQDKAMQPQSVIPANTSRPNNTLKVLGREPTYNERVAIDEYLNTGDRNAAVQAYRNEYSRRGMLYGGDKRSEQYVNKVIDAVDAQNQPTAIKVKGAMSDADYRVRFGKERTGQKIKVNPFQPEDYAFENWQDRNPLGLGRETLERNIDRVAGTDAPRLKKFLVDASRKNETDRSLFLNTYRQQTRENIVDSLGIKPKTQESALVQRYGEGLIGDDELRKLAGGRAPAIAQAANYFKKQYDDLLDVWNAERSKYGYEPVPKRQDYFRHFREIEAGGSILGIIKNAKDLPTNISGMTDIFRPNKPFSTAEMKRLSDETTFDAVSGFDNYLDAVSRQIYHLDTVQRGRNVENAIRKAAESNPEIELPNFVANLSDWTNMVSGKKSRVDRAAEQVVGRKVYTVAQALRARTGANMVGANLSSAMTNYIPFTQSLATTSKPSAIKGMMSAAFSPFQKNPDVIDGVRSGFLTRRFVKDSIKETGVRRAAEVASKPFEFVDLFTSRSIVAGKFYENVAKGMNPKQAMKAADDYASKVITDRSVGQLPNLMETRTAGFITQFQAEVNNQVSFLARDIPGFANGNPVKIANSLGQFVLFSYMFNTAYEKLMGRRPQIDPIQAGMDIYSAANQDNDRTPAENALMATPQALKENISQGLPFTSLITGGRLPVNAMFPDVKSIGTGLSNIGTDKPVVPYLYKGISGPLYYGVPPFGGGQIRKTAEGLYAAAKGESVSPSGKQRFTIDQNPLNVAKAGIFGQYATNEGTQYIKGLSDNLAGKSGKLKLNNTVSQNGKDVSIADLPLSQRMDKLIDKDKPIDEGMVKQTLSEIAPQLQGLKAEQLGDIPVTTATAKIWSKYQQKLESGNVSPVEQAKAKRDAQRELYKIVQQQPVKDIIGVSDSDLRNALEQGLISQGDFEKALDFDNKMIASGINTTPYIGNKLREQLGYDKAYAPGKEPKGKSYARGGKKGGRGSKVKLASPSDVIPTNYVKGLKVKSYRAPSSSLRIAQPRSGGGVKVRLAKQAKTIKKA